MQDLLTVSAGPVHMRIQAASLHGVDRAFVLEYTGIDAAAFEEPEGQLSILEDNAVWNAIIESTKDEYIGLKLAQQFTMTAFGVVGYVVLNAGTLGEAMRKFNKYERLVIRTYHHFLDHQDERLAYGMRAVGLWYPERRYTMDFVMAGVKKICEELTGHLINVKKVCFQYPLPRNLDPYHTVFGNAELVFDAEFTHIIFEPHIATLPVIGAIPEMAEYFDQQAEALLQKYDTEPSYSYKVKRLLIEQLKGDVPTLSSIASHLAMSTRSLQEKLKTEGVSFQLLLNSVRCDLATRHLTQSSLTKTEIAYLLGFSEVSAFSRVFKKWTGQTPSAYQQGI